jgi:hypothetical protein
LEKIEKAEYNVGASIGGEIYFAKKNDPGKSIPGSSSVKKS